MKPNFALKLSNEGIELLHRADGGWLSMGSVDFASDDVARGCARLIADAERLEPGGICTKLVLPDDETRYTSMVAPGPTDEARRYQIEAEIEALTPYTVDELAYDWVVEGDSALVVVCAKETLAEAEGFAEGYGFNPVSFVAAPEAGQFNGEPFFGQTSVASTHLPAGETLQRDSEPVRVIGPAPKPTAAPDATAESKPAPSGRASAPSPAGASGSAPASRPTAAPRPPVPPSRPGAAIPASTAAVEVEKTAPPRRTVPSMPALPSEPLAKVGGLVRRMGTRLRREQAQDATTKPVTPPAPALGGGGDTSPPPFRPARSDGPNPPTTPATPSQSSTPRAAPIPGSLARPAPDDKGAGDGAVAFASRRHPEPRVAASGSGAPRDQTSPGGRIAVLSGTNGGTETRPGLMQGLLQRGRGLGGKARALVPQRADGDTGSAQRRTGGAAEPLVAASRPPVSEREKATEAEALTIFGARGTQASRSGLGGPVLLGTGAVLLLVVAVAAWALYFRNAGETNTQLAGLGAQNGSQIEAPAGDPIEAPAALDAPDNDGPALAALDAPDPQTDAPALAGGDTVEPTDALPQAGDPAAAVPLADAGVPEAPEAADPGDNGAPVAGDAAQEPGLQAADDPDRLLEALVDEALNEALPDVQRPEAAPETAQTPPAPQEDGSAPAPGQDVGTQVATRAGGGETIDAPQVASSGTAVRLLSLPSGFDVPPLRETAFTAPPPPPPPGTDFAFDERGLVEATPDGALTPAGVTVIAGRPAVVPAPRPLSAIPRDAVPPDFPRADPELAEARPRPRSAAIQNAVQQFQQQQNTPPVADPDDADPGDAQQDAGLQPAPLEPAPGEAQPETAIAALEDPDAPPPGGVSLAALRPQTDDPRPQRRPTDLVPPVADDPVAAQDDVALIESDEGPQLDLEGATEEAVAASLQPRDRPADVAERAQAALAELAEAEEEREEVRAETRAAQPDIPTSASVARQATQTDAIRLNQVNLIGVFGTPDDRRALVRLSSGRVVRVQVGDRLDGGRVTAIGTAELRYSKSGRNVVLEIDG